MQNSSSVMPALAPRSRVSRALVAAFVCAASIAAIASSEAVASTSSTAPCADEVSYPFSPWGDNEPYRLAPDGDFSEATSLWTLSSGAELVADDSPISGGTALALDGRESALSAPICVDGTESFSRVMIRSDSNKRFNLSGVLVEAVAPNGRSFPVGAFQGDTGWEPSSRFLAPRWLSFMGIDSFQYEFTAIGKGTTHIDDLYVDPRSRH